MGRPKIIISKGSIFGYWTVVDEADAVGDDRRFSCRCTCGVVNTVYMTHLRSGISTSCGCQLYARTALRMTTHGQVDTPTYSTWHAMYTRCNPSANNKNAIKNYAGITICERWKTFENFLADMGERPSLKHEIDRKKNHLGYTPANCRWVTRKVNLRNKKNNFVVTMDGRSQPLSAWCEELNLNYQRIYRRMKVHGMSLRQAIDDL